ncbi:MAG: tol-pal system protein YbgF [Nitrosomonas sp.]|nr:tol-pal system protein YbgF [Nitrosomonas sp.]
MRLRAFLLLLFLGSNPCFAGLFDDAVAREQIEAMKARIDHIENTLAGKGLIELHTQGETIRIELGKLRGQLEELQEGNRSLRQQQKDFYLDLDSRLRALETGTSDVSSSQSSGHQRNSDIARPSEPANHDRSVIANTFSERGSIRLQPPDAVQRTRYDTAYNLFKDGNYVAAIVAFKDFIKQHPQSELAPSAAYWVGNSHYAQRDFDEAITAQQWLIETYPASPKVPDALLNIASSQMEKGQGSAAKKTLQDLISRYPDSGATIKAKARFGSLKK